MVSHVIVRDPKGRFYRLDNCPICGDGLVFDGERYGRRTFHCEGLVDPNDDSKPLAPCEFEIADGDPKPEPTHD